MDLNQGFKIFFHINEKIDMRKILTLFFAMLFLGSVLAATPVVEVLNPSDSGIFITSGNYSIEYTWSDSESPEHTNITGELYYSQTAGSFSNTINNNLNLHDNSICIDSDSDDSTPQTCSTNWNTSSIADGQYFIDLRVTDDTSLSATDSSNNSFWIDNTAPITSENIENVWTNETEVELSCTDGTGSGCAEIHYRIDVDSSSETTFGDWQTTTSNPVTINFNTTGIYDVEYYSIDNAGNEETVKTDKLYLDLIKPSLTNDAPVDWQDTTSFTFTLTAEDSNSGVGILEFENLLTGVTDALTRGCTQTKTLDVTISSEGTHAIDVNAIDCAGNITHEVIIVKRDNLAPVTQILEHDSDDAYVDQSWRNDFDFVDLNCDDSPGKGCYETYYTINSDPNWRVIDTTTTQRIPIPFTDGEYLLEYYSVDYFNHDERGDPIGNPNSVMVRRDTVNPTINFIHPANDSVIQTNLIEFTINFIENSPIDLTDINVIIDGLYSTSFDLTNDCVIGADGGSAVCSYTDESLLELSMTHNYELRVQARDLAGNQVDETINFDYTSIEMDVEVLDPSDYTIIGPINTNNGVYRVEFDVITQGTNDLNASIGMSRYNVGPFQTNGFVPNYDLNNQTCYGGVPDFSTTTTCFYDWNAMTVLDYNYYLNITIWDPQDNSTWDASDEHFLVDFTAPIVSSDASSYVGWQNEQFAVVFVVDDGTEAPGASGVPNNGIRYRINGGEWVVGNPIVPIQEDGNHTIEFEATDRAGNVTTIIEEVALDTTPPVINNVNPADLGHTSDPWQIISMTLEDTHSGINESSIVLTINGVNYTIDNPELLFNLSWLVYMPSVFYEMDSEVNATITVSDNAGNESTYDWSFFVDDSDSTPPNFLNETPPNGDFIPDLNEETSSYPTIEDFEEISVYIVDFSGINENSIVFSINDVNYTLDDDELRFYDNNYLVFTIPEVLNSGVVTIKVWAADEYQNMGFYSWSFTVDLIPPETIVDLTASLTQEKEVSLEWSSSQDALAGLHHYNVYRSENPITWDRRELFLLTETTSSQYLDETVFENKEYYYRITAVDNAGNESLMSNQVKIYIPDFLSVINISPRYETVYIGKNDSIGLVFDIENISNSEQCIDFSADTDSHYIEAEPSIESICLNAGESTTITLTIKSIDAPYSGYEITLIGEVGNNKEKAFVDVKIAGADFISVETVSGEICSGKKGTIPILIKNLTDKKQEFALRATNEVLLPYFEQTTISLDAFEEDYFDLVVNASTGISQGEYDVSIYVITENEQVKTTAKINVSDCSAAQDAVFELKILNTYTVIEKFDTAVVYYKLRNLLNETQEIKIQTVSDLLTETANKVVLEPNQEKTFSFTIEAREKDVAGDHFVKLYAWNTQYRTHVETLVAVQGIELTEVELLDNDLLIEKEKSEVVGLLVKNTGDLEANYSLEVSGIDPTTNVILSETNFSLNPGEETVVYASILTNKETELGNYSITLVLSGNRGLIAKEVFYSVVNQKTPSVVGITSYPATIFLGKNSEKEISVLVTNFTNDEITGIEMQFIGLPEGITVSNKTFNVSANKTTTLTQTINASDSVEIGEYKITLIIKGNGFNESKEVTVRVAENGIAAATEEFLAGLASFTGNFAVGLIILILLVALGIALVNKRKKEGFETYGKPLEQEPTQPTEKNWEAKKPVVKEESWMNSIKGKEPWEKQ